MEPISPKLELPRFTDLVDFATTLLPKRRLPHAGKRGPRAKTLTLQILNEIFRDHPNHKLGVRLWDDTSWPDTEPRPATLVLKQAGSLRAMLLDHTETAIADAYLDDVFDVEGDMEIAMELADALNAQTEGWAKKLSFAAKLLQLPPVPDHHANGAQQRAHLQGRQHSPVRDREAILFHYDISNDFFALWLDPQMVYSCAYFQCKSEDLETAQRHKLDYICRKLRLRHGQQFLDIGCGWGGLVLHAARYYDVHATGITLSEEQARFANQRVREAGLEDRVVIRLQDYRELYKDDHYDAIASVGMVEHVGREKLPEYFRTAYRLLKPGGVFLNHGIGTGTVPRVNRNKSFMEEYVFPDTDLFPIALMLQPAEEAGFEIRDVESLREHYAMTLRNWVRRLEAKHEQALRHINEPTYRVWRLYMAACAHGFAIGQLSIYQTLLAKLDSKGCANLPLTRSDWY